MPRQRRGKRTLKPTSSTTADSCTGGTPFSVTGAAGASDILRGWTGDELVGLVRMNLLNRFLRVKLGG